MIDIAAILGSVIVILAAAIPVATIYYKKSVVYLDALKDVVELVKDYADARADGTFTEAEYANIGRRTVAIVQNIDQNPQIPLNL